jgi:hypothetical protein
LQLSTPRLGWRQTHSLCRRGQPGTGRGHAVIHTSKCAAHIKLKQLHRRNAAAAGCCCCAAAAAAAAGGSAVGATYQCIAGALHTRIPFSRPLVSPALEDGCLDEAKGSYASVSCSQKGAFSNVANITTRCR